MVRPFESAPKPDAASRVSLDDQLASVVEQEGMTVLAADGVRLMLLALDHDFYLRYSRNVALLRFAPLLDKKSRPTSSSGTRFFSSLGPPPHKINFAGAPILVLY